jgi:DNA primase
MSAAEDIKAKLDIVAYIQQYVPLKKAGRTYKACCPFHNEKTPSFVVDPVRGTWRCFGSCATGGDVISFAMKKHGWSFSEALQELARQTGVQLRARTPQEQAQSARDDHLRGLLRTASERYHSWLMEAEAQRVPWQSAALKTLAYARDKRGLTDETLARFQIGYAPGEWGAMTDYLKTLGYAEDDIVEAGVAIRSDSGRVYDRFRHRLMIPIRDERGRVVGFGARALAADDNPKYLNSPQSGVFDKSRLLFGLDLAREAIRQAESVVIVEGYLDVIQAHQAGYANVVAQMGTAFTDAQLKLVAPRLAARVLLALDSDAAGQNATMRSLEVARRALSEDFGGRLQIDMRVLNIPGAKDPDDFLRETPEGWPEVLRAARPVADFVIDFETRSLPADASIFEREAVARRVLPLLLAAERDLYRQDNVQKLAGRLRVDERTLMRWAASEAQPREKPRPSAPDEPRARSAAPVAPPASGGRGMGMTDDISTSPELPPRAELVEPPMYDEYGAPLVYDDDIGLMEDAAPPVQLEAPSALAAPEQAAQWAKEQHCLAFLVENPELLYRINRALRQMAGQQTELARGPLCDFGPDDFLSADFQALWPVLFDALAQNDMNAADYVQLAAQGALRPVLEALRLPAEQRARGVLKARMEGDADRSWQQHQQHLSGFLAGGEDEPLLAALRLRAGRLQRDGEALQSLIRDPFGDDEADNSDTRALTRQAALLAMARHRINQALAMRRL